MRTSPAATLTQHETQGIHEYRFSGAGLTGEHRHPSGKLDLDLIDNREIPYLDTGQHLILAPQVSDATVAAPMKF